MAKNNKLQNTTQTKTATFVKGLNKDSDPSFVSEGTWTHARNASNNTDEGNMGTLSNEASNALCQTVGSSFTGKTYIVGVLHVIRDKWAIMSVTYSNNGLGTPIGHEIGLFEEDDCRYRIIVQDDCLNFDRKNLITGGSRELEDCSRGLYFADGKNPDRYINIGDSNLWPSGNYVWAGNNKYSDGTTTVQWPGLQWEQDCQKVNDCYICTDLPTLDCDAIRLARLMSTPEVVVNLGVGGGTLFNGSYFAVIAYSIKGQKVTDYFSPSNTQPLYNETDGQGSLTLSLTLDSENFDEFQLVIVKIVNEGAVAKLMGTYSTSTSTIHIDQIKEDLITVPVEQIPIRNAVYETSDQITEVNDYLLRIGPKSRFDFNYQPLANLIQAEWVSVEYTDDYYVNGGSNASYLRDETYAFFIRWIYTTGDKTPSYHIPGRKPENFNNKLENTLASPTFDKLENNEKVFEVYNTASITGLGGTILPDGGKVVSKGKMAYHESSEIYPDKQPEIWNSSAHCWTGITNNEYDLCGKNIRHHKFPDNVTDNHFGKNTSNVNTIRILGVQFKNIVCPKDNDGNDISGIAGYEILRGSREGNRSIIAKGMINNLRSYSDASGNTGYYPNYPFNTIKPLSNSIGGHVTGYNDPYIRISDGDNIDILQTVPLDYVTFHSPDTNFRNPYLGVTELKLYGSLAGTSNHKFIEPAEHPKVKLLANTVVVLALVGGVIKALAARVGKKKFTTQGTTHQSTNYPVVINATGTGGTTGVTLPLSAAQNATVLTSLGAAGTATTTSIFQTGFLGGFATGGQAYHTALSSQNLIGNIKQGAILETEMSELQSLGALGIPFIAGYFVEGTELVIETFYNASPYRQYALQSIAHGLYDKYLSPDSTKERRFNIEDVSYLKGNIQSFDNKTINNLNRAQSILLKTSGLQKGPHHILGSDKDTSLVTLGTAIQASSSGSISDTTENITNNFNLKIASHYAGIKVRLRNQYAQLENVKQLPATPFEQKLDYNNLNTTKLGGNIYCTVPNPNGNGTVINVVQHRIVRETPVFFGGDVYINRYTEKNNMTFFYDWLYGQPDGYENNYLLYDNIPQPRFWMNSIKYDIVSDGFNITNLLSVITSGNEPTGTGLLPTNFYNLDYYKNSNQKYNYDDDKPGGFPDGYPGFTSVKDSYFYLANSSVREFYVESDVIVDFRNQPDPVRKKHYDSRAYTDLTSMFKADPEILKALNVYEYDYSLSISKAFTQYFSQGNLQSRYYNPQISELCYTYYPDRLLYSLPQQQESSKDSWFVYLANNYKDFGTRITSVKPYAKTGMFITFPNKSPKIYQGVDSLKTDLGTKVTIGDGGLFSSGSQNVTAAEGVYEYGASQSMFATISTPVGLYFISQNQGKLFSFGNGLKEVSQKGMKWWFNKFLPYKIVEDFPNYPLLDNPVAGVGCQTIYDNSNSVLYFSKKDYKLKPEFVGRVEYLENSDSFLIDGSARVLIGDPLIFEKASWTISFDPKNEFFLSFHDWDPDFVIPGRGKFLTIKEDGIWKHNDTCRSFCNFYGIQYPFEIELPFVTGQTVTTLKSMEYVLECYKNSNDDCIDQFHVLDYNFDQAIVYNSEQVSGYLNLNLTPKNNITLSNTYPIVNTGSIDILFSKEENKYRFNQFWDITSNRGEFPDTAGYPVTGSLIPGTTILNGNYDERNIWVTQSNGYIKTLNPLNLDYAKPFLQRKKFRHYLNFLNLSKTGIQDTSMILKLINSKNQLNLR